MEWLLLLLPVCFIGGIFDWVGDVWEDVKDVASDIWDPVQEYVVDPVKDVIGEAGIGAGLGGLASVALAPFTGGATLSMLPYMMAGGGMYGGLMEEENQLMNALMGGLGGYGAGSLGAGMFGVDVAPIFGGGPAGLMQDPWTATDVFGYTPPGAGEAWWYTPESPYPIGTAPTIWEAAKMIPRGGGDLLTNIGRTIFGGGGEGYPITTQQRGLWDIFGDGEGKSIWDYLLPGAGMGYSIYSQREAEKERTKRFEELMGQYRRITEPQITAMEEFLPYYRETLGEAREVLPRRKEAYEKLYGTVMEGVSALPEEDWAKLWQQARQRLRMGYGEQLTALGERAAGAGTLRGGPIQQLATQLGISQAEAERDLGLQYALQEYFEKQRLRREDISDLYTLAGYAPGVPSMPMVGMPGMPTAPVYEGMDPTQMGYMLRQMTA